MRATTRSARRSLVSIGLSLLLSSACGSSSDGNPNHDGGDASGGDASGGEAGNSMAAGGFSAGGAPGSAEEGGGETTRGGAAEPTGAAGEPIGGIAGDAAGAAGLGGAGGETSAGDCTEPWARSLAPWDGRMPDGFCTVEHVCQVAPLPGNFGMKDMWGTSSSDLWIVGEGGSIVHFDGQTWTGIRSIGEPPADHLAAGAAFWSVHGTGSNDVWVLGQYNQLLHFNGRKWSGIAYEGKIRARTLWAQAPCDVWLFGDGGRRVISTVKPGPT